MYEHMVTKDKQIKNFRFTPEFADRLAKTAKLLDMSQTTLVKQAIQEKLAKLEKNLTFPIDK